MMKRFLGTATTFVKDVPPVASVSGASHNNAAAVAALHNVIRSDWKRSEIEAIYQSPLIELVFLGVSRKQYKLSLFMPQLFTVWC
jgi:hypothetical protein